VTIFFSLVVFPAVAVIIVHYITQAFSTGVIPDDGSISPVMKETEAQFVPEQYPPNREAPAMQVVNPARMTTESPSIATVKYLGSSLNGFAGRITAAYRDGYPATLKAGITMMPQTTLREYLMKVEPLLPGSGGTWRELTLLTEVMLYSNLEPDEPMAVKAEKLARNIRV
jgi:hypothetical protein